MTNVVDISDRLEAAVTGERGAPSRPDPAQHPAVTLFSALLDGRAHTVTPVVGGAEMLGLIIVTGLEPDRHLDTEEVAVAEGLVRLARIALDRLPALDLRPAPWRDATVSAAPGGGHSRVPRGSNPAPEPAS